jgi:hypothetical protein
MFCWKYPDNTVLCIPTINIIITIFRSTESVLDKNISQKREVLTEEKVDNIRARLEASQKQSLGLLSLQCGLAKVQLTMVQNFCKLQPFETRGVHSLFPLECEATI